MSENLEVRPYAPGDEDAIRGLFAVTFGREQSSEHWRWRYLGNPVGTPMIELMWDDAKLVGHYSVSPMLVSIDGEPRLAALSLDTMTHPDYGRRGIFSQLATSLYGRLAAAGYAAVYGFPNANSHHGFVSRLDWKDIATVPTLTTSVSALVDRDAPPAADVKVRDIEGFDARFDALFERLAPRYRAIVRRSRAYLEWRYVACGWRGYRIVEAARGDELAGYCVFKTYRESDGTTTGDLVDVFCETDPVVFASLVGTAARRLADRGADRVSMWRLEHDPLASEARTLGFHPSAANTFWGARQLSPESESLGRAESWFLSEGDSDVY